MATPNLTLETVLHAFSSITDFDDAGVFKRQTEGRSPGPDSLVADIDGFFTAFCNSIAAREAALDSMLVSAPINFLYVLAYYLLGYQKPFGERLLTGVGLRQDVNDPREVAIKSAVFCLDTIRTKFPGPSLAAVILLRLPFAWNYWVSMTKNSGNGKVPRLELSLPNDNDRAAFLMWKLGSKTIFGYIAAAARFAYLHGTATEIQYAINAITNLSKYIEIVRRFYGAEAGAMVAATLEEWRQVLLEKPHRSLAVILGFVEGGSSTPSSGTPRSDASESTPRSGSLSARSAISAGSHGSLPGAAMMGIDARILSEGDWLWSEYLRLLRQSLSVASSDYEVVIRRCLEIVSPDKASANYVTGIALTILCHHSALCSEIEKANNYYLRLSDMFLLKEIKDMPVVQDDFGVGHGPQLLIALSSLFRNSIRSLDADLILASLSNKATINLFYMGFKIKYPHKKLGKKNPEFFIYALRSLLQIIDDGRKQILDTSQAERFAVAIYNSNHKRPELLWEALIRLVEVLSHTQDEFFLEYFADRVGEGVFDIAQLRQEIAERHRQGMLQALLERDDFIDLPLGVGKYLINEQCLVALQKLLRKSGEQIKATHLAYIYEHGGVGLQAWMRTQPALMFSVTSGGESLATLVAEQRVRMEQRERDRRQHEGVVRSSERKPPLQRSPRSPGVF